MQRYTFFCTLNIFTEKIFNQAILISKSFASILSTFFEVDAFEYH